MKLNDIDLKNWKDYSFIHLDSWWEIGRRDSSGVHTAGYHGNFVPQIPFQMMWRYTKKEEWVLDPFAGMGTTLIEAQRLGRNSVGIELQQDITDKVNSLLQTEKSDVYSKVFNGDSRNINYREIVDSVQLAILHPPYHDIIKFSDDPRDLSNASSMPEFLDWFGDVVNNVSTVLDKGRYLVLVIGDKYENGEWVLMGFETANRISSLGYTLKGMYVKNFEETLGKRNQKALWDYRTLANGLTLFKHEYIFVFKRN